MTSLEQGAYSDCDEYYNHLPGSQSTIFQCDCKSFLSFFACPQWQTADLVKSAWYRLWQTRTYSSCRKVSNGMSLGSSHTGFRGVLSTVLLVIASSVWLKTCHEYTALIENWETQTILKNLTYSEWRDIYRFFMSRYGTLLLFLLIHSGFYLLGNSSWFS